MLEGSEDMIKSCITIIGMPAVGKTTIGRLLSEQLKIEFFDTDAMIESQMKMKTFEVTLKYGRSFFHKLERMIVQKIIRKRKSSFILSLGGAGVVVKDILDALRPFSLIIWLDADEKDILLRFDNYLSERGGSHRKELLFPSTRQADLARIRNYLVPLYARYSDYHIKTLSTPQKTVEYILKKVVTHVRISTGIKSEVNYLHTGYRSD